MVVGLTRRPRTGSVMNLSVNTHLRFPDGEEAGRITRVILVPDAAQPQSVVVATPGLVRREVVVPVSWLHEGPVGVQVDLDPDTLDALYETAEIRSQQSDFSGVPWPPAPGGFLEGGMASAFS